jgi:ribosome-associated heat shock protein Hsp15
MAAEKVRSESVRLDVWLDVSCLFKTRSEAQKACQSGKVTVNGQSAKPNRALRPGDEITIGRPYGRTQKVRVRALADKHVAKADATPEEMELRRLERLYRAAMSPPRAPDKRDRRLLRRLKGLD